MADVADVDEIRARIEVGLRSGTTWTVLAIEDGVLEGDEVVLARTLGGEAL